MTYDRRKLSAESQKALARTGAQQVEEFTRLADQMWEKAKEIRRTFVRLDRLADAEELADEADGTHLAEGVRTVEQLLGPGKTSISAVKVTAYGLRKVFQNLDK
jgi:hypothetical protein